MTGARYRCVKCGKRVATRMARELPRYTPTRYAARHFIEATGEWCIGSNFPAEKEAPPLAKDEERHA